MNVERSLCTATTAAGRLPLTPEQFDAVCVKHGFVQRSNGVVDGARALLDILDRWGSVLQLRVNTTETLVFPHPPWLMSAVKRVIGHTTPFVARLRGMFRRNGDGVLNAVDVSELFETDADGGGGDGGGSGGGVDAAATVFSPPVQAQLLQIFKRFHLLFQLDDDSILFPSHFTHIAQELPASLTAVAAIPDFPSIGGRRMHRCIDLHFAPTHLWFTLLCRCYPFMLRIETADDDTTGGDGDAGGGVGNGETGDAVGNCGGGGGGVRNGTRRVNNFFFKNGAVLYAHRSVIIIDFTTAAGRAREQGGSLSVNVRGPEPRPAMHAIVRTVAALLSSRTFGRLAVADVTVSCPMCLDALDESDDVFAWDAPQLFAFRKSDVVASLARDEKSVSRCACCCKDVRNVDLISFIDGDVFAVDAVAEISDGDGDGGGDGEVTKAALGVTNVKDDDDNNYADNDDDDDADDEGDDDSPAPTADQRVILELAARAVDAKLAAMRAEVGLITLSIR
jgi:hypothetical protein